MSGLIEPSQIIIYLMITKIMCSSERVKEGKLDSVVINTFDVMEL